MSLYDYACDIQLHVDLDAADIVLPKAHSRGTGKFYLSIHTPPDMAISQPPPNGPILIEYVTLRNIMMSAVEAETGTFHHNGFNIYKGIHVSKLIMTQPMASLLPLFAKKDKKYRT